MLIKLVLEPGGYRTAAEGCFSWLILALPGFLLAHGDTPSMQRLDGGLGRQCRPQSTNDFGVPGLWGGMRFNRIAAAKVLNKTGIGFFEQSLSVAHPANCG